jgi:hypothetical protein
MNSVNFWDQNVADYTHLPNTIEYQICYLVKLSQDEKASPFTKAQENIVFSAAKKIATTDRWLRYGYPLSSGFVCLNGSLGVAATVVSLHALPVAATLATVAVVFNCVVATVVQPVSWFSTGTAPDQSSTAQDERQDALKEAEQQYEKIAAKIIQTKFRLTEEKQTEFADFIRLIDIDKIQAKLVATLGNSNETLRHVEMLHDAQNFVLYGRDPEDITLSQEVRLNQVELRPQAKHARAHRAARSRLELNSGDLARVNRIAPFDGLGHEGVDEVGHF